MGVGRTLIESLVHGTASNPSFRQFIRIQFQEKDESEEENADERNDQMPDCQAIHLGD